MALEKLLKEKVPYHARVYPKYYPIRGCNFRKKVTILYKEDLQMETDDMSGDKGINDDSDGGNKYPNEGIPIAQIRRAYKDEDEEFEGYELFEDEIFEHWIYNKFISFMESDIREKNWSINEFKIFHIWNVSLNKKPISPPWPAKFQYVTNEIELEIHSQEQNVNGESRAKVNFSLEFQDCDTPKIATVGECEMKYSLFSNARRVKFEIRPYNGDGSPASAVNGRVHAYVQHRGTKYEKYLVGGENKYEKSKHIAGSDTLTMCFALILPRDICLFNLDMSLNNDGGNFALNNNAVVRRRSIAIDEEHHIVGEKGYIILKAIWGCLCVDLEQGVCTCPGIAFGFQAENNDICEGAKDEPVYDACSPIINCNENSIEGRTKKARIRQTSSTPQETTCCEDGN